MVRERALRARPVSYLWSDRVGLSIPTADLFPARGFARHGSDRSDPRPHDRVIGIARGGDIDATITHRRDRGCPGLPGSP
jgi:hypothetical protein